MGARLESATAQLGGASSAGQAAGAVAGAATAAGKSAAEFVTRPIRTAGTSVAEAYRRGELRAWNPSPPENPASGTPQGSGMRDIQGAMHTAQTIRSAIPPEGHGGGGMQAPIRPE